MKFDYSKKCQKEADKRKLSVEDMAMADLMALGWRDVDAFVVLGFYKSLLSDSYNEEQLEIKTKDDDFRAYYEKRKRAIERGTKTDIDGLEAEEERKKSLSTMADSEKMPTKDELMRKMLDVAEMLPPNDPRRLDAYKAYGDFMQMKKDEVKEEDTTVHYYLPLPESRWAECIATALGEKAVLLLQKAGFFKQH